MSSNRRSKNITEGVARAPNRSMYYAMGYTEGDFGKPMIGVANGHSHDHALQLRPAAPGRRGGHRAEGRRRQPADLRHADHQRRHGHGHRRHEVQPGVARGHRRLRRDLRRRPVDGRRDGHRRLRQEHARRHDGHAARQRAGHLHLRRHHPARPLQGPGPEHRQRVRGGGPVQRRQDERGRLLPDRAPRHPGQRLLRRHVHRQHHELGLRGAGHEPALRVDDGQRRGRDRRRWSSAPPRCWSRR